MTELFKDNLSEQKIHELAIYVHQHGEEGERFELKEFKEFLLKAASKQGEKDWELLSLMQRLRAAAQALLSAFPREDSANAVLKVFKFEKTLSGWLSLVACEYIATHPKLSLDEGMNYLQQLTEFFSAEFAIRHYILLDSKKALKILMTWLEHDNYHVRRLISEGTRPRLPWGVRLPIFIQQPELVIPLLEALRDDEEEYVRRSVANHLNDIAKDHPQLVINISQKWLSDESLANLSTAQQKNRLKLIRHASRTLFKQGNPEALALFGYKPDDAVKCSLTLLNRSVVWGGDIEFEIEIMLMGAIEENKYMIDYVIYYQKANGTLAPKVFKWIDRKEVVEGEILQKKHSFKAISTRKYYPGLHKIEVVINGIKKAEAEFNLSES